MKKIIWAGVAAMAVAAAALPATAHDHGSADHAAATKIELVLAADIRAEDRARDASRNPGETLAFFGITPDMTVGEYSPGGGWYTRILAPLVAEEGGYVAITADVEKYLANADEARIAAAKQFPTTFPPRAAGFTGLYQLMEEAIATAAWRAEEMGKRSAQLIAEYNERTARLRDKDDGQNEDAPLPAAQ
jgi:hypothetical protein